MAKTEYELIAYLKIPANRLDGIYSEPLMLGDAHAVIHYILKKDSSVEGYKLVKRIKR